MSKIIRLPSREVTIRSLRIALKVINVAFSGLVGALAIVGAACVFDSIRHGATWQQVFSGLIALSCMPLAIKLAFKGRL
jgi:hypothetical protein